MKGDTAKHVLLDAFENLAERIHHHEKKEFGTMYDGEDSKYNRDQRRKAIEAIRENISLFRMNLK